MKAIILCAGKGGRLRPLTENKPKCLLEVGSKTLLERILDSLGRAEVGETLLVVGFRQERVRDLVRNRGLGGVNFIVNERFESSNTAHSLRLALDRVNSDFILINGDILFDGSILQDLVRHPQPNCVVVDRGIRLAAEEVKVQAADGSILRIGKDLNPEESLGEAIGVNKFSREVIPALSAVFQDLERRGEFHHYFEKGIDRLCCDSIRFGILFTDKAWVEIDTPEDLDYATREIQPRLDAGRR